MKWWLQVICFWGNLCLQRVKWDTGRLVGEERWPKDHGVAIVTSSFLSQSLSWDCIHSCHQGPGSNVARDDSGGKETILVRSTSRGCGGNHGSQPVTLIPHSKPRDFTNRLGLSWAEDL